MNNDSSLPSLSSSHIKQVFIKPRIFDTNLCNFFIYDELD